MLKRLFAKAIYHALLQISMHTGIPEIICTVQGTNLPYAQQV